MFFVSNPLVISFDSLFGFVLVVAESMSIYAHVISRYSFTILFKPSKYVLIVINNDSIIYRG